MAASFRKKNEQFLLVLAIELNVFAVANEACTNFRNPLTPLIIHPHHLSMLLLLLGLLFVHCIGGL